MAVKLIGRFVGSLLGVMTGDALGRAGKNRTPEELLERDSFGHEMIGGFYTEDTEMTISVTESLLALGRIDPDELAQRFAGNLNPMRGYNPGALEVLYALQQGIDWRDANRLVFEDGSFGVGGSCRAAPIGLYYHDNLDELVTAAMLSARVTHAHPIGEAGAVTVALAVGLALQQVAPRGIFEQVQDLLAAVGYADFLPYLSPVQELLEGWPNPPQVVEVLGNRLTVQQCVPAALYSVLRHPDSFEKALIFAVNLGGEADSIGALAGAIAGAYHGVQAIPMRWWDRLENEERGRDYLVELGERLYDAWREWTAGG